MKPHLILILALAMLAMSGCVTLPTADDALIQRHVAQPVTAVEAAIKKAALSRGFTETSRNVYQQAASYPVDPILGVVKTSNTPNSYLRLVVEMVGTEKGTLVKISPYTEATNSKYKPFYWRAGTPANAMVAAMLDAAIAESMATP